MADSNITKRALANALKDLMREQPFSKISISDICDRCDMNRKSFYYHFRDKYDLFNWCFDTEFIEYVHRNREQDEFGERWETLERACTYFYQNRDIYCNALKVKGQNCFADHLREFCFPILKARIAELTGAETADDFAANFFTDAALCAIIRWLTDKSCMSATEFTNQLRQVILSGATYIYEENNEAK